MELTVDSKNAGGVTLIYPRGFINAHTVRLFENEIQRSVDTQRFKIVVNCSDLRYIASAGLGAMMGVIEDLRGRGGDLRLSDLGEGVKAIFEMLGFTQLYRVYPSEVEAVASFGSGEVEGPTGA